MVVLVNVIGAIAVLSAELFFFLAFPVLVIGNAARPTERGEGVRPLLASAAELSLILIAFALSTVFRGNPAVATAINESWSDLWPRVNSTGCCLHRASGAIDSLQWAPARALGLSASVLHEF